MAVYKFSKDAFLKLEEIYEYSFINFGEPQADEYILSLHEAFELLAEQPGLGRKFHEFHKHEHRDYTFFYKIIEEGILIVHIYHQKENITDKIN